MAEVLAATLHPLNHIAEVAARVCMCVRVSLCVCFCVCACLCLSVCLVYVVYVVGGDE
jgi:hypothetical protein